MATLFRPVIINPSAIEEESFRIIDSELSPHFRFSPVEHAIIRRVIHATADFEYARNMRIHGGAFEAFQAAMAAKADIICDVQMVMAGVSSVKLAKFGGSLISPISDPDVAEAAKAAGHTRAIESMRKMARRGQGGGLVASATRPRLPDRDRPPDPRGELASSPGDRRAGGLRLGRRVQAGPGRRREPACPLHHLHRAKRRQPLRRVHGQRPPAAGRRRQPNVKGSQAWRL